MTFSRECEHDLVYGLPFSNFKAKEIDETISNYAQRFSVNSFNPQDIFQGKRCLDAGCGYGRGSLFMLQNGAAMVDAVDISPTNIATTSRQLTGFGFDNVRTHASSIECLPFEDETFQVVWCYGVIHHAANTDACLQELGRVLKVGGQMNLFVYGSGGVFWYSMRRFREILNQFPGESLIAAMRLMGFSTIEISNFIDSWKTAYLRCYTHDDLVARLRDLGFADPTPQAFGCGYDLNHRKSIYPSDQDWMGEGDLRYLLTKTSCPKNQGPPLSNSEYGSDIPFASQLEERFGPWFKKLADALHDDVLLASAACGYIHRELFALLRKPKAFEPEEYSNVLERALTLVDSVQG